MIEPLYVRDDAADAVVASEPGRPRSPQDRTLGLAVARAAVRALATRGAPPLPPAPVRESRTFVERIRVAELRPETAHGAGAPDPVRAALVAERDRIFGAIPPAAVIAVSDADVAAALAPAHAGILGFVADLCDYVEREPERLVRRLARSPFSGMPRPDASALAVAAGDRSAFAEIVRRGAVPLGAAAAASAHAFVDGLAACAAIFRAQGSTAAELIATIALRFGFENLGERPRSTVALARAEALALDAASGAAGTTWQPQDLASALRARASSTFSSVPEPRPFAPAVLEPEPALERTPARERFARVEPEPGHDVRRKTTHFSASALGMYASCERRWYYRYVCASVEDAGSSASFYGSAFHWALENFHKTVKRADVAPLATLERDLDAHVVAGFARFRTVFETPVEFELQVRRARRTAKRYIAWFVARSKAAPFEVVGIESEARMQLDGYDFIGYIDRLDRDDRTGAITVVDYKTGSIAESAREYRRQVAEFEEFQLPFYYWARTAAGERVSRLALVPLKDATRDVEPVELEIVPVANSSGRFDDPRGTIGIDELTKARTKMIEHARHLSDEPIERFAVTEDAEACAYCPYVHACRERPAGDAERFGR